MLINKRFNPGKWTKRSITLVVAGALSACAITEMDWFEETPDVSQPVVAVAKPSIQPKPHMERLPHDVVVAISGHEQDVVSAVEAIKQLRLGQLDKFSPYYHRAEQYLLLELQIQQLINELAVYFSIEPSELYYRLAPLKNELPALPFRQRGAHIVEELVKDQLSLYAQHSPKNADWLITPKLTMRFGKICLQLVPSDFTGKSREASMALPITDYYFYDYLDGIRQN